MEAVKQIPWPRPQSNEQYSWDLNPGSLAPKANGTQAQIFYSKGYEDDENAPKI